MFGSSTERHEKELCLNLITVRGNTYEGTRYDAQDVRDLLLPRDVFTQIQRDVAQQEYPVVDLDDIVIQGANAYSLSTRYDARTNEFHASYLQVPVAAMDHARAKDIPLKALADAQIASVMQVFGILTDKAAYAVARYTRQGAEPLTEPLRPTDFKLLHGAAQKMRQHINSFTSPQAA